MADFPVPSYSDGLNIKEIQKNGNICICVAVSLWCTVKLTLYCVGNTHQKIFFLIMADNFSNGVYDLGSNQKQQLHAKTAQWIPNGMEPNNLMSRYIIISSCCIVQSLNCFWLSASYHAVEVFMAFLPRSLLISWLQSASTVIVKLKRMKSVTVSIFPHFWHTLMEPDTMIFVFWMWF